MTSTISRSRPESPTPDRDEPAIARVLLIASDPDVRGKALGTLRDLAKEVVPAADGVRGLLEFLRGAPDVVVVDQDVRGMDGVQLLIEIRARSHAPIVLLADGTVRMVTAVSDVHVLPKPFGPQQLRSAVAAALAPSRFG